MLFNVLSDFPLLYFKYDVDQYTVWFDIFAL